MIYKPLHKKLKIKEKRTSLNTGVNTDDAEG